MDPELFPVVPEDLSALSDEELADLQTQLSARAREITAGEADVGELSAQDVLERMTAARADYARIAEEITGREAGREAFAAEAAELAAEMGVEELADASADDAAAEAADDAASEAADDAAAETAEAEVADAAAGAAADAAEDVSDADTDTEDVAASTPAPRLPARARRFAPPRGAEADRGAVLTAAADIRGTDVVVRRGEELTDRRRLGAALAEAFYRAPDNGQEVIVASADLYWPEERRLKGGDSEGNWQKIAAVVDPSNFVEDTILATGGLCAPFTTVYDFPIYATVDRPVRAALAGFQADRGGIQYPPPLTMTDVTDAVGVMTAANDELGGTNAAKPVLILTCDEFETAGIYAVSARVRHGNFNARAWPERVARVADLVAAYHARVADSRLLTDIGTGSTALTDEAKYGAVSTLLQGVLKAAARMRSGHRMSPEQTLRLLIPSWVPDLMLADIAHTQSERFQARSRMAQILGAANVAVTFYLDEEANTGQIFDTVTPGGNLLAEFPLDVVWYLFPEGAWLFLDGGRLDLGVVRDSVLNETNDFEVFYETFEGSALVGAESIKVTSTVCPSGEVAIAADNIITCST